MAKFKSVLLIVFFLALLGRLDAGTYTLSDGQTITGEPISYDGTGVVLKLSSGAFSARTPWSKFTQESLKQLKSEAKKTQDAEYIDPYLEDVALEEAQQAQITIKPPERIERPTGRTGLGALFSSSLGIFLFLVLYGANIYAAYEIAIFKNMPFAMVCGAAAVVPFLAPIVFLFIPGRPDYLTALHAERTADMAQQETAAHEHVEGEGYEHAEQNPEMEFTMPAEPVSAPAPAHPSVTFRKGEFTFNRRFFETKMPGFFRVVPSESEKDMVLQVKAMRGEYIAKRIPKITQTEVHLETFKEHATAEEIVPFTEIQEVSIRHKDSV